MEEKGAEKYSLALSLHSIQIEVLKPSRILGTPNDKRNARKVIKLIHKDMEDFNLTRQYFAAS